MDEGELTELIDLLDRAARSRPPSKPPKIENDAEVLEVHRALQEVIVNFPHPKPMDPDVIKVLQPLFALFGNPSDSRQWRIAATLDAAIKETRDRTTEFRRTHQTTEFWEQALQGTGDANARLNRDDVLDYQSRLNTSVKELAELLVHAVNRRSNAASTSDPLALPSTPSANTNVLPLQIARSPSDVSDAESMESARPESESGLTDEPRSFTVGDLEGEQLPQARARSTPISAGPADPEGNDLRQSLPNQAVGPCTNQDDASPLDSSEGDESAHSPQSKQPASKTVKRLTNRRHLALLSVVLLLIALVASLASSNTWPFSSNRAVLRPEHFAGVPPEGSACYTAMRVVPMLLTPSADSPMLVSLNVRGKKTNSWLPGMSPVSAGSTLTFILSYMNNSSVTQKQVNMRAILPPGTILVPNSTCFADNYYQTGQEVYSNQLNQGGLEFGSVRPDQMILMLFSVAMPAIDDLGCGETDVRVRGGERAESVNEIIAMSTVSLFKNC